MQTVGVLLPVAAATFVSAFAFWFAPDQTIDGSMRVLIPALVTFLPGSLLTTATLDLSAGEVISGSSRLVAGTMQLVLLSFGIVAGAQIAGIPPEVAITNEAANTLGDWAPWLGVVVFGVGAFVHFSGPRGSLGWLLVVLLRRLDRAADRRAADLRRARWVLRRAGRRAGRRLGRDAALGAAVAGLVPARVLAARPGRGRPDRRGRVRRLQPRGRSRSLRQRCHHLHRDRARRAGRQRPRAAPAAASYRRGVSNRTVTRS